MNKKGFTLVELLAVIVILAILATAAFTLVIPRVEKARKESFLNEARTMVDSSMAYFLDNPKDDSVGIEELFVGSYASAKGNINLYSGVIKNDNNNYSISISNCKYQINNANINDVSINDIVKIDDTNECAKKTNLVNISRKLFKKIEKSLDPSITTSSEGHLAWRSTTNDTWYENQSYKPDALLGYTVEDPNYPVRYDVYTYNILSETDYPRTANGLSGTYGLYFTYYEGNYYVSFSDSVYNTCTKGTGSYYPYKYKCCVKIDDLTVDKISSENQVSAGESHIHCNNTNSLR